MDKVFDFLSDLGFPLVATMIFGGAFALWFIYRFIVHNRWFIYSIVFPISVGSIFYSFYINDLLWQSVSIIILVVVIVIGFVMFSREPKVSGMLKNGEQEKLDKEKETVVDVEVESADDEGDDSADDKKDDDGEKP